MFGHSNLPQDTDPIIIVRAEYCNLAIKVWISGNQSTYKLSLAPIFHEYTCTIVLEY